MSVMIDIQMPENCLLCPVHREKGENIICPIRWSIAAFPGKGRPSWCPLTETEESEVEYLPGDKIYHVYYEAAFPDEASIDEQTVVDASVAGFIRTQEYPDEWIDTNDRFERLFRTREEAEKCLEELKALEVENGDQEKIHRGHGCALQRWRELPAAEGTPSE